MHSKQFKICAHCGADNFLVIKSRAGRKVHILHGNSHLTIKSIKLNIRMKFIHYQVINV